METEQLCPYCDKAIKADSVRSDHVCPNCGESLAVSADGKIVKPPECGGLA